MNEPVDDHIDDDAVREGIYLDLIMEELIRTITKKDPEDTKAKITEYNRLKKHPDMTDRVKYENIQKLMQSIVASHPTDIEERVAKKVQKQIQQYEDTQELASALDIAKDKSEISTLKSELQDAELYIAEQEKRLSSQAKKIIEQGIRISDLEYDERALKHEIEDLKKKNQEQKIHIDSLSQIKEEATGYSAELLDHKETIKEQSDVILRMTREKESLNERLTEVSEDRNFHERAADTYFDEKTTLQSKITTLETENKRSKSELARLKSEKTDVSAEADTLKAEISNLKQALEKEKQSTQSRRDELGTVYEELRSLREEFEKLPAKIEDTDPDTDYSLASDLTDGESELSTDSAHQETHQLMGVLDPMFKNFDFSLETLKLKSLELGLRGHKDAEQVTLSLYENIKNNRDAFMQAPSRENFNEFSEQSIKLIENAEKQLLNKHRGSSIFSWVQEKIGADTDTMIKAKGLKEALNKIKLPDELDSSNDDKSKFKK